MANAAVKDKEGTKGLAATAAILGLGLGLGLGLAVLGGLHSGRAYYREHATDDVPSIFADDPWIVMHRGEAAIFGGSKEKLDSAKLENAARQVLREDPLNPNALHILGVFEVSGERGNGSDHFLLAEKLSRRHQINELTLASIYAQHGDVSGTVRSLDRAVSVRPEILTNLAPGFVDTFEDPKVVKAFAPYAYRPWFFNLIGIALDRKAPIGAIDNLITAAEQQQPKEKQPQQALADLRVRLLSNILTSGNYAAAQQQMQRLPQSKRAALEKLGFLAQNTSPELAPMSWSLANDNVKSATLDADGALQVSVGPEQTGVVAERMTIWRPATYVLTQVIAYNDSDPKAGLLWDVVCEGANGLSLWHQGVPTRPGKTTYQTTINVPANCPVQHWYLRATGDLGQSSSQVAINALSMVAK